MSEKIAIKYNKKNICRLPIIPYTKVNSEDIIAGINNIDAEYWHEAKKHTSVKQKIEAGIIEEIKTTKVKKEIEVEKEVIDEETKKKKTVKSKQTNEVSITEFVKLKKDEKEKIIKETYNIKSLQEFKDAEVEDSSIRYLIEKRIDEIKNAKTDDTIDHPESHLKG